MKVILTGSIAPLKAISKLAKGFKGVSVEVITEEGDSTPSPSIVDGTPETPAGEPTEVAPKIVDEYSTINIDSSDETSEEVEGKEEKKTKKGKNK